MSQVPNDLEYRSPEQTLAAHAAADERADFIRKTYLHLAGAVAAFVGLEAVLLNLPGVDRLVGMMLGGRYSWLVVLGLFIFVSWIAEKWAESTTNPTTQYMGLGLYVVAESILFVPLLFFATKMEGVLPTAAIGTLVLFGAMTCVVFFSRADFSFMRSALMFGGIAAMGLIVCAIAFNFALGPIFSLAMIALACGYILFHTSNVLHHYRIGQHVAASLALFASVALLFWYILLLVMASRD